MFVTIGRIVDRYRVSLLIGWITIAVIITLVAPNLDDVTNNEQSKFLSEDTPALVSQNLVKELFPDYANEGNIVLVFEAQTEEPILSDGHMQYIDTISTWLTSSDAPEHIQSVLSPTLNPEIADTLLSSDQRIGMIVIFVNTSDPDEQLVLLDKIKEYLENVPSTLKVYRTGEVAINAEYNETLINNVDRTIFVTLALVIFILLTIYRSPVSPLIPLSVVTVAYLITRGIVAWLGQNVVTVTDIASMLLVVVMYGAGTDYCLFLISRFREEITDRPISRESVHRTVGHVGETIFSSAGTVIAGFLTMSVAKLGLFNTTGPALAIGVIVSLLVGLTLTPALLSLLGKWTFWPARTQHRNTGGIYKRISQWVSAYPLLAIVGIVMIMLPFAYWGSGMGVTYDFLVDLPDDTESTRGFRVLEKHIGAGEMQPLTAVAVFEEGDLLSQVDTVTQKIATIDGVASVRSATQPLGGNDQQTAGITHIDRQFSIMATLLTLFETLSSEPTPEELAMKEAFGADLPQYLELVAQRAPELAATPEFEAMLTLLTNPTTTPAALAQQFDALAQIGSEQHLALWEIPSGVAALFGGEQLAEFMGSYLNLQANAARFEIVLDDAPYSLAAMDTIDELRAVVDDTGAIAGSTAINADIRDDLVTDQRMTIALVLSGIFIILVIMLRSIISPLYLIGTILLSYGSTLGITRIASEILWGTDQLTWWVPFFMFVFLVALGIDYSIFLFGRIKEEVGHHGAHDGIHLAVQSTGSIITSAGIMVAGTFGALMAGSILGLKQIGFAVTIGILIDTFVVRTILVPALASIFGRWTWWPGKVPQAPNVPHSQETIAGEKEVPTIL